MQKPSVLLSMTVAEAQAFAEQFKDDPEWDFWEQDEKFFGPNPQPIHEGERL